MQADTYSENETMFFISTGFSRVLSARKREQAALAAFRAKEKLLKQLLRLRATDTGLKPSANEMGYASDLTI